MKKLMMSALLLTSFSASAIEINVSNPTCTGAYAAGTICQDLRAEIKNLAEADLPDASIGDYGTGISNANGFAYKGLGSDYADNFDFFMVRAAGGVAVDGNLDDAENADGFGIGAAATVGINLDLLPIDKIGPIDLEKMDLFVSFMSYDLDQDNDNTNISGEISNFSVMARYQIMDGKDIVPGYMLEWGGVFLHTGFQRSSWDAKIKATFDDETVTVSGQDASFNNSSAQFGIESTTTTIPVEVSTYLRAAYVFTFFGGAGFDLVSGSTDVDLSAGGTVAGSTGGTFSTTISATESASGDADATNFRAFGGVQFNVPFFRLYAQFNKGLGNNLVGANLGMKILW